MKTLIICSFSLLFFVCCSGHQALVQKEKDNAFYWEGKRVSKKKFDRKLYQQTVKFIKTRPAEEIQLLSELSVIYDTIPAAPKKETQEEGPPKKE